ncbi:MAG TPA: cyclic nucleotide-binding domain-containing protein [Anaeromyxobacteraceae bacterium]
MAALAAAPAFQGFTETGLRIFATIAAEKVVPAGSPLFVENMMGESMFVVVSGKVRLVQRRPDGSEWELAQAGPGEQLGELAILAPSVRLVSAVADGDCVVLELAQRDFQRLAPQKPQACLKLAAALVALLARRVGDARDSLREALARTAQNP